MRRLNRLVGSIFVVWTLSPKAYLFAAEFREPAEAEGKVAYYSSMNTSNAGRRVPANYIPKLCGFFNETFKFK